MTTLVFLLLSIMLQQTIYIYYYFFLLKDILLKNKSHQKITDWVNMVARIVANNAVTLNRILESFTLQSSGMRPVQTWMDITDTLSGSGTSPPGQQHMKPWDLNIYMYIYIWPHGTTDSSFFHVVVMKAVVQMPIVQLWWSEMLT